MLMGVHDGVEQKVAPQRVKPLTQRERILKHRDVWQENFDLTGIKQDVTRAKLPDHVGAINHLIVRPGGIPFDREINILSKYIPMWSEESDLSAVRLRNARGTQGSDPYAVLARHSQESDFEYRGCSAKDLEGMKISGMTLSERIWFEYDFHRVTGLHLDVDTYTLCTGSPRYSDGMIPAVCWNNNPGYDRLEVIFVPPDPMKNCMFDGFRVREVITI